MDDKEEDEADGDDEEVKRLERERKQRTHKWPDKKKKAKALLKWLKERFPH